MIDDTKTKNENNREDKKFWRGLQCINAIDSVKPVLLAISQLSDESLNE